MKVFEYEILNVENAKLVNPYLNNFTRIISEMIN